MFCLVYILGNCRLASIAFYTSWVFSEQSGFAPSQKHCLLCKNVMFAYVMKCKYNVFSHTLMMQ